MYSISIIQSTDSFLIHEKIEEIKKQNEIEEAAVSQYDLEEHTLSQVLEDLDTYSFLTPKKCIIVFHPSFLTSDGMKIEEKTLDHLTEYSQHPNPDHILIFVVDKLDERKKIVKQLKQKANMIVLEANPNSLAKTWLQDYQLESGALSLLLEYCRQNTAKLYQECDKLKLYRLQEKRITKEDVSQLVERELDSTDTFIFSFVNSLISKNKKESIEKYQDLKALGYDSIAILGMLANQFRFLFQVKTLFLHHKNKEEIRVELDCHPYRIDKAKEQLYQYTQEELLNCLDCLAELDYKIKSGAVDADTGLENFILTM